MDLALPTIFIAQRDGWTRKRLVWALVLSAGAHVGLLAWTPSLQREPPQPLPTLEVELLVAPPKPEPPPPPKAEEPPPKPEPVVKPTPPKPKEPRPLPPQPAAESQPFPLPTPEPVIATEPDIPRPPETVPLTVPAAPPPPVVETPKPVPAPPPAPSGPDPGALEGYGRDLSSAIAREPRYPRVAQMRGWEGTSQVALHFAASGSLERVELASSSGHEVLDRQALDMVERARPLPQAPPGLVGQAFQIIVPIHFRLQR